MTAPTFNVLVGDCRELLAGMPDASFDACVTDPPYGLEFMGKDWDAPWKTGMATVGLRGGRREWPQHGSKRNPICRACGARQRGKIKCVCASPMFDETAASNNQRLQEWAEGWAREVYRVLKPGGRMLAFGGSRTHHRIWCAIEDAGFVLEDTIMWLYGSGFPKHKSKLKPAYEPICVARKGPASVLNIDSCRIEGGMSDTQESWNAKGAGGNAGANGHAGQFSAAQKRAYADGKIPLPAGRWPANVVLDEEAAGQLDEQSGELTSGANPTRRGSDKFRSIYDAFPGQRACDPARGADSGGASRFFYTAKASRSEREFGLEGGTKRSGGSNAKGFTDDVASGNDRNRPVLNSHPTVKPVDLMRWLVRLVTPVGGHVLDPFTGSGTTGVACIHEGFHFIGCELNPDYAEMARRRIGNAPLPLMLEGT